jgi:hypothetical protein
MLWSNNYRFYGECNWAVMRSLKLKDLFVYRVLQPSCASNRHSNQFYGATGKLNGGETSFNGG